ncbi:MAG: DUF1353 domain-containing protein [Dehalococcoidia bacterium]|nr:DUF1353 domain-containing protein [Dehalococcoidia bacterium]
MSRLEPRISVPGRMPPAAPDLDLEYKQCRSPAGDVWVSYSVSRNIWRIRDDVLIVDTRHGRDFVVPAGYETDLSSVPRLAWWLIAPFELSVFAPLGHDPLYGGLDARYTRAEADLLFLDLMVIELVPRWRRELAYPAVRLRGGPRWRGR